MGENFNISQRESLADLLALERDVIEIKTIKAEQIISQEIERGRFFSASIVEASNALPLLYRVRAMMDSGR